MRPGPRGRDSQLVVPVGERSSKGETEFDRRDDERSIRLSLFVSGAFWCKLVYSSVMSIAEKLVRQSVSLPARVARQVKSLAKTSNTSANRIIVDLIQSGIEAREQEKKRFHELADRLTRSRDAEEKKRLKEELARMTFGE